MKQCELYFGSVCDRIWHKPRAPQILSMEVHRKIYAKSKKYNNLYYVNGGTQDKDEK